MTAYARKGRKTGNPWRIEYELGGVRHFPPAINPDGSYCKTRKEAEAAETRHRDLVKAGAVVAVAHNRRPSKADITLAEALLALTPKWKRQKDWGNMQTKVGELVEHFGHARRIIDISPADIREYNDTMLARPLRVWSGGPGRDKATGIAFAKLDDDRQQARWRNSTTRTRSNRTENAYVAVLLQAFKYCREELRDDDGVPLAMFAHLPTPEKLPTTGNKANPIPADVFDEVFDMLQTHVVEAVRLTLLFGFRKMEALNLTIDHVHFQDPAGPAIYLAGKATKGNADGRLAISADALPFLRSLVAQARARGQRHLITYSPYYRNPAKAKPSTYKPVQSCRTAWDKAMDKVAAKRNGKRWRWHDIRAAAISTVAAFNVPAAQKLARHKHLATTMAYVGVADADVITAADKLAAHPSLSRFSPDATPPTSFVGPAKVASPAQESRPNKNGRLLKVAR